MIKNFQELVSQLKTQVPIQELISEFVSVKKSGRGYVALCPFHDDHHPSLQIHPQKGIFKCFSCGTGGDLITFYALINKKKWSEVIPELALKYGLQVEYGNENKTETQIKNQLYELNRTALDFFKTNLFSQSSQDALNYLKNTRKLSQETIEKYEIGLALNSWDSLYNYLVKEKHLTQELIIASGLFALKENGQNYYDRFRNRIIFPIFNENYNVIGFGGRALSKEDNAKYLNSPETLIFNKGSNLYGLNFAKEEIKKCDSTILTEGYFDVITAHQFGLLNTVATLGTAMTPVQARLLTKYTESKKVYLCMDTDIAGKKAVESIFSLVQEISQYTNVDIRVANTFESKDLDEELNNNNTETVKKRIENSQKIMHFIFDKVTKEYFNTPNEITKKSIIEDLIEIIILIKDPIEQNEGIKYICHKLSIEEEIINHKIKSKIKSLKQKTNKYQNQKTETKEEDAFKMYSSERFKHAELELLALYIGLFPYIDEIKKNMQQIEFLDEKHKLIKDFLDNTIKTAISPQEVINQLIFEFNEYKHIMSVISDLAWRIETDDTTYAKNKDKILSEAKQWIKWWITNKQKMKMLTDLLKDCKTGNEENEILTQMMELVKG